LAFGALSPHLGMRGSASLLGATLLAIAFLALRQLEETYGKDLDFTEP